jgi:hypothetical protein
MSIPTMRVLALTLITAASSSVFAESYTAKVFGVPGGFDSMEAVGQGDNGMMSGFVDNAGEAMAAYLMPTGAFKNMHPSGWFNSQILDSWGSTYHCGVGKLTSNGGDHALFWVGGGAAVDINPTGAEYTGSIAYGGGGQLQVGMVEGSFFCPQCGFTVLDHAGMWSRTAASFARLHAPNHDVCVARATDGVRQVGDGFNATAGQTQALMWNGPNSTAVNMHPTGYTGSLLYSIWGNQQGGIIMGDPTGHEEHAALWTNTPASVVDLNPNSTFIMSKVNAVRNGLQVGSANPISNPNRFQAIAWHGVAGTWINLHARLPYPFTLWRSSAEGIDNLGNITGYVWNTTTGERRPVLWLRS